MSHTPGPWRTDGDEILADDGDVLIANMALLDGVSPDAWQANMRVVAAAPDLLATLTQVHDWLSSFSMPPTSTIQEKQDHMALIEAAIAKAEGREV